MGNRQFVKYNPLKDSYTLTEIYVPGDIGISYSSAVSMNGKIYLKQDQKSKNILVYDLYKQSWTSISDFNVEKSGSALAAVKGVLYCVGGNHDDLGGLDIVESIKTAHYLEKPIEAQQDEELEIALSGVIPGAAEDSCVTLNFNPKDFHMIKASSLFAKKDIEAGKEINGLKYLYVDTSQGVAHFRISKSVDAGKALSGIFNVIPLKARRSGKLKVSMYVEI